MRDAKNRCARPHFQILGDHPFPGIILVAHPAAYIVSVNLARRNLTKGQQTMLLAMVYPEPKRSAPTRRLTLAADQRFFTTG
jgi:hypothetical protein